MATNKDADILTDIIQRLHLRVAAGAATVLLKVKSHRGGVLNEVADVAAENGRGIDDNGAAFTKASFTKASGKLVLSVEKDGKLMQSTWTKGIQAAIRWQGGQHIVRQRQRQGDKVWVQRRLRRSSQPWLGP